MIIPEVDRSHEGVNNLPSERGIVHRAAPEFLHPVYHEVSLQPGDGPFLHGDGVLQPLLFGLQFLKPPLRGGGDDTGFYGFQDIIDALLCSLQLISQGEQLGGISLPLLVGHDLIRHPLDHFRLQDGLQSCAYHHPLDPVTDNILLLTLPTAVVLTGIVVVKRSVSTCARHTNHRRAAGTTEQLPGEHIFSILPVPPLGVLLRFQFLSYLPK